MNTRVMDLTRSVPLLRVSVEWKPVYELLITLSAYGSTDIQPTFDSGRAPFEEIRTTASAQLLAALERLGPRGGKNWGALIGFAWSEGDVVDAAGLIERLKNTSARDLQLMMFGYKWPGLRAITPSDVFVRAAEGSPEAQEQLVRNVRRFDPEDENEPSLRAFFAMSSGELKSSVMDVLSRWHDEVFATREDQVTEILRRDAEAKRALARTVAPEKLIEVATHGLEYTAQSWTQRVVLVPHLAMRPWNILNSWDDAIVICYPAEDEVRPVDDSAPPPQLLRVHKALGDEKRLRMLKVLSRGTATLQELADAVGLAKSSAHHHTVILRSAGLITVTLEDNSRYTLRRDAVPEVSGWLRTFLEGGTSR